MPDLLGPHLLQPFDALTDNVRKALKKWQPPVCVVFMDNVFKDTLANYLKPPTRTSKSIKELMDPDPPGTALYGNLAAVKQHLAADKIEAHIKPFTGVAGAGARPRADRLRRAIPRTGCGGLDVPVPCGDGRDGDGAQPDAGHDL